MTQILESHRLEGAFYIANLELREKRNHQDYDAGRAHNRLCDVIEAADDPHGLLDALVKRLGRVRALAVQIDMDTVEHALRS